jgi:hypothetical protein
VRIEIARAKDVLSVREAALRFSPQGEDEAPARTRLWKHEGGSRLEPVDVTAGLSDGAYTQITPREPDALAAGDEVAVGLVQKKSSDTSKPGVSLGSK